MRPPSHGLRPLTTIAGLSNYHSEKEQIYFGIMTTRRCFQAILPKRPGCEALKLVVSERDNGQWAALLIDPAIGQERSEPLADGLEASKRMAISRAMAYRRESAQLSAAEEVGRIEEYFRLLEWKGRPDRAKFLRHYGALRLRVEQIGPQLWVGSVYAGCWQLQTPNESVRPGHVWERFTALTEEAAKVGALETACKRIGPAPDGSDKEWRCLSDIPEDDWSRTLNGLGFPEYPEREGMERWSGF